MNGDLLLDTNIIIAYLRGDASIISFLAEHPYAALHISVITRMELLSFHGITLEEESCIRDMLASLHVVLCSDAIEQIAIRFRRATRAKLPDALVAASAIAAKATLVTCDAVLVRMAFPGLRTINPCL
jgi:predicted nucleic acid-binding protein